MAAVSPGLPTPVEQDYRNFANWQSEVGSLIPILSHFFCSISCKNFRKRLFDPGPTSWLFVTMRIDPRYQYCIRFDPSADAMSKHSEMIDEAHNFISSSNEAL